MLAGAPQLGLFSEEAAKSILLMIREAIFIPPGGATGETVLHVPDLWIRPKSPAKPARRETETWCGVERRRVTSFVAGNRDLLLGYGYALSSWAD
jgi:hypothetical protein